MATEREFVPCPRCDGLGQIPLPVRCVFCHRPVAIELTGAVKALGGWAHDAYRNYNAAQAGVVATGDGDDL